MPFSPYIQMQRAVDVVLQSPHPVNKVAATVYSTEKGGKIHSVSRTNYWPDAIEERIGTDIRIGNSSGTVHAETAAILASPCTSGASLFVTDPFCPNCAKNIAEAGIKTVYVDHKGFEKDFIKRRGDHFTNMSMQVCEKAGISVYEIYRKEEKLVPIYQAPDKLVPYEDSPVVIKKIDHYSAEDFIRLMDEIQHFHYGRKNAAAFACNESGDTFMMYCRSHPALGYSMRDDRDEMEADESKYSFIVQPINRLLMNAARYGVKIIDGFLFSSMVPTAREQVNLVGAGLTRICIDQKDKARDESALQAMQQLSQAGIVTFLKPSEFTE